MTIQLDKKESEGYFFNAMCNGLDWLGGYGLFIDYSTEDKNKAKAFLKEKNTNKGNSESMICREDILMQILRGGGKLTFVDEECDGEYTKSISLIDVHERVGLTDSEHLLDMKDKNDDVITADCILQSVIYKEVIFG